MMTMMMLMACWTGEQKPYSMLGFALTRYMLEQLYIIGARHTVCICLSRKYNLGKSLRPLNSYVCEQSNK